MKTLRLSPRSKWPAMNSVQSQMNLLHIPTTNLRSILLPPYPLIRHPSNQWSPLDFKFTLILTIPRRVTCPVHLIPLTLFTAIFNEQTMELFIIPPWHKGVWKHCGEILYRLYVGIMQQPLYLRYASSVAAMVLPQWRSYVFWLPGRVSHGRP
jgi:hypothetical protein